MATIRMYLTAPIPGLERHFTREALAELTALISDLYRGRANTDKGNAIAEGYIGDAKRAAEILRKSAKYSYVDVNASLSSIIANPGQGWNRVLREAPANNPIHKLVKELGLAAKFFKIPELDLKTIDEKDYLIGTEARELYIPDRAVAALEEIAA